MTRIEIAKRFPDVNFDWYLDRIRFAMTHNFQQREELLCMIGRVAFIDSFLTEQEYNDILVKLNKAHTKSLEMNYNETWKH